MLQKEELKNGLRALGVMPEMILEVHSSLRSFGQVEGGADTVIAAIKETVTEEGSIFMPALRLSRELPLTEADSNMGITVKIKILKPDCEHSAMGVIADTFRKMPDTCTGEGVFRISGWGKYGAEAAKGGLHYALNNGGKALLLGVDIYKLTAMHCVEDLLPQKIKDVFAPNEKACAAYPPDEWFVETGYPPVKAWYTIQRMAYDRGMIREGNIGKCKAMLFDLGAIVGLYAEELRSNPYKLYGLDDVTQSVR